MVWAKPYFDKKKTWILLPEKKYLLQQDGKMAWFDELLDTQMKSVEALEF